MKLLVLLSRVPYPLDKGDKLRAYHQLSELSKDFEISLFCLNEGKIHPKAVSELKKLCIRVEVVQFSKWARLIHLARAFFNKMPFQVNYFYSKNTQKKFDKFLQQDIPDVMYCQLIRTTEYIKKYQSISKVLDYMDAFSTSYYRRLSSLNGLKKWIVKKESNRLLKYETEIAPFFNFTTIISEQDKASLSTAKNDKLNVIPNGVNTNFFQTRERKKDTELVFVGNMNYPPNIDAAEVLVNDILPVLSKKLGYSPTVMISGTSPHARVKALENKYVKITGFVEDIRDSYDRSKIFVAPLRQGAGLQNKLLEAMSMNLPCVTSPLANNALKAKNGEEIIVADDANSFAQAIQNLLTDDELKNRIAKNGRSFVHQNFSWKAHTGNLKNLLEKSFF